MHQGATQSYEVPLPERGLLLHLADPGDRFFLKVLVGTERRCCGTTKAFDLPTVGIEEGEDKTERNMENLETTLEGQGDNP